MQDTNPYSGNPLQVDEQSQQQAFNPNVQQQQQNQQQSQQGKSQLGSKDLSMIEDMLNHEAMAYKKCSLFSSYFTDEALSHMANMAAAHHKQHFEALQSYMSQHQ